MAGTLQLSTGMARRVVPRVVLTHPLAFALVLAVVLGGGIRFVPGTGASAAGTTAGAPASTACAAQ